MSHNIGTSLPTIITAVCCFRCAVSTTTCTPLSAVRNLSIYTVCHVRLKCGVRIVAVFKSKTYRFNQKLFDQNIFARTAHLISTATALTDSETIESSTTLHEFFHTAVQEAKKKLKQKWENVKMRIPISPISHRFMQEVDMELGFTLSHFLHFLTTFHITFNIHTTD